jgi:Na+-translocating ferredoxin:NAD+ oxidoreductase RnfG subunit
MVLALVVLLIGGAHAKVFHSRSEAVELAFPEADRIEDETLLIDDEKAAQVEKRARAKLESRIIKVYRGYQGDTLLGYAFIDLHKVRSLPEAFLVVLSPEGAVRSLRVLAFHEPLEYMPTARWYEAFVGKTAQDPLRVGGDIHGIVGATLSTRATSEGVRRALALFEIVLEKGK